MSHQSIYTASYARRFWYCEWRLLIAATAYALLYFSRDTLWWSNVLRIKQVHGLDYLASLAHVGFVAFAIGFIPAAINVTFCAAGFAFVMKQERNSRVTRAVVRTQLDVIAVTAIIGSGVAGAFMGVLAAAKTFVQYSSLFGNWRITYDLGILFASLISFVNTALQWYGRVSLVCFGIIALTYLVRRRKVVADVG